MAWLSGVGGEDGSWKPGNQSHLTWPPPLTCLPPREPPSPLPQLEEVAREEVEAAAWTFQDTHSHGRGTRAPSQQAGSPTPARSPSLHTCQREGTQALLRPEKLWVVFILSALHFSHPLPQM